MHFYQFHEQTVDPAELCKETTPWMIISAFSRVILRPAFAVFGVSYQRNVFESKTENARSCFTLLSVSGVPFLQTEK